MCPVCMATLALVTAGVTSTGGITAVVASKLGRKHNKDKE